jgi:hypothetical protein
MKNLYLFPTDKPSRLAKILRTNFLQLDYRAEGHQPVYFQYLYITSDEEIKDEDWCIDIEDNIVFKVKEQGHSGLLRSARDSFVEGSCKKIILTTDPDLIKDGVQSIDDEFLEWFVKNPSCEKVEVSKQGSHYWDVDKVEHSNISYKITIPKVEFIQTPDNLKDGFYYKTIIPQEESNYNMKQEILDERERLEKEMFELEQELVRWYNSKPKQETLEEGFKTYYKNINYSEDSLYKETVKRDFKEGAHWQAERMYSEEDLREAFRQGQQNMSYCEVSGLDSGLTEKEWFEQFKKK